MVRLFCHQEEYGGRGREHWYWDGIIESRPRTTWGRKNLAFLKDPLIVNRLRLNMPERLEALGAILRRHITPTQEELESSIKRRQLSHQQI